MESPKKYRSKVDLSSFFSAVLLLLSIVQFVWIGESVLLWLFLIIFISDLHRYFSLWYRVSEENKLIVKNGWFFCREIDVMSIISILPSRVKIGSPALVMDGLEITYNGSRKIYITPREEAAIIGDLIAINPQIELRPVVSV